MQCRSVPVYTTDCHAPAQIPDVTSAGEKFIGFRLTGSLAVNPPPSMSLPWNGELSYEQVPVVPLRVHLNCLPSLSVKLHSVNRPRKPLSVMSSATARSPVRVGYNRGV